MAFFLSSHHPYVFPKDPAPEGWFPSVSRASRPSARSTRRRKVGQRLLLDGVLASGSSSPELISLSSLPALPRNWANHRLAKPSHWMWCPSGSVWQPKMCRTRHYTASANFHVAADSTPMPLTLNQHHQWRSSSSELCKTHACDRHLWLYLWWSHGRPCNPSDDGTGAAAVLCCYGIAEASVCQSLELSDHTGGRQLGSHTPV